MRRAQRIAFVCPRFVEGATAGGAETLMRKLAERAARDGRDVKFLTTCATDHFTWANAVPPGDRRVGALDVGFHAVNENRDIAAFLRTQDLISRHASFSEEDEMTWLRNSVNSDSLCGRLERMAPELDCIIAGPYLFGLTFFASKIAPQKTFLVPCLHREGFAYTRAMREMFRSAAMCLFNTEAERRLAEELYSLPPERCAVVGMGMDDFEADPKAFAARRKIAAPYVLFCGRREAGKGVFLLMDYMAAFRRRTGRDVKLVLAGSGEVSAPPELAGGLIDVGFLPEAEKHEAMAGAAVFCQPSVNESLSIVLLEAWLARAAAMVHAACDVTREHCRAGRGGLWFAVYPEFEEQLLLLLDNEPLRRAMAEAGRRYVLRRYSWEAIETRFFNAIDAGITQQNESN